jgi:hypothetical protein
MNKIITTLVLILSLASMNCLAESHSGKVKKINMYGGEWSNSWRGGILYQLDTMPAGVSYFTVRASDIAFQTFLAALLSAKHAQALLTISYSQSEINGNGYVNTLVITQE